MKKQKILMSDDVNEFFAINSEDRKSLIVFEMINVVGDFPIPPLIVIQGQKFMSNWFSKKLFKKTKILISKIDFIFDKIVLIFLQHFIENSDVNPTSDWKLMFMNVGIVTKMSLSTFAYANTMIMWTYFLRLRCERAI